MNRSVIRRMMSEGRVQGTINRSALLKVKKMIQANLHRETEDLWKWYVEFFNEVIRLDNAEVPLDGQQDKYEPRGDDSKLRKPIYLFHAQEGTKLEVLISGSKILETYTVIYVKPIPSEWFLVGKRTKDQAVDNLGLEFFVRIDRRKHEKERSKEPYPSGSINAPPLCLKMGVTVYVDDGRPLTRSTIESVLPWVRGSIAHELKHLWNAQYFPPTDPVNRLEGNYPAKPPALYDFDVWLSYFRETKEVSAHVDQIAQYSRDSRVTFTKGFDAIIKDKIGRKGKSALKKGKKFQGSMEKLVQDIYDKQLEAFNKVYPTNRIVGPVFPDKSWFAEHGSSLFSNPHDAQGQTH